MLSYIATLSKLTLYVSTEKYTPEAFDVSYKGMTRSRLNRIMAFYQPLFGKYRVVLPGLSDELSTALNEWAVQRFTGKVDLQKELFLRVLSLEDNLKLAYDCMPSVMRKLLYTALVNRAISRSQIVAEVQEASEMLQRRISTTNFARLPLLADEVSALFMPLECVGYRDEFYHVDPLLYMRYARVICPVIVSRRTLTTDVLPERYERSAVSHEDAIAGMMPHLREFYDEITCDVALNSADLPVKVTDIKRMSIGLAFPPILPVKDDDYRNFTEKAVWNVLAKKNGEKEANTRSITEWYKQRIGDLNLQLAQIAQLAAPFCKPIQKSTVPDTKFDVFEPVRKVLLKYAMPRHISCNPGVWLEIDSFVWEVIAHYPLKEPLIVPQPGTNFTNEITRTRITPATLTQHFVRPFVSGIVMIFLALGLVEVIFDPNFSKDSISSCIRYVRLTALGRYVFGRDSEYELPADCAEEGPEDNVTDVAEDRLMIYTTNPVNAEAIRKLFGKRVTDNRFIVTDETFLRGVSEEGRLKDKIKDLKRMVKRVEMPQIWTDFFESLAERFNFAKVESLDGWRLYDLTDCSDRIYGMICADKEIRELIRLVEGRAFMVQKKDVTALRSLFKSRGYVLPPPCELPYGFRR